MDSDRTDKNCVARKTSDEPTLGERASVLCGKFLAIHEREEGRDGCDWGHDVRFRDRPPYG